MRLILCCKFLYIGYGRVYLIQQYNMWIPIGIISIIGVQKSTYRQVCKLQSAQVTSLFFHSLQALYFVLITELLHNRCLVRQTCELVIATYHLWSLTCRPVCNYSTGGIVRFCGNKWLYLQLVRRYPSSFAASVERPLVLKSS